MGLRTLSFVFGVATALSAQFAVALGLGEIRLNSTLNQPLDAEIQLLQVRDLSEREILVGLASLDDFKRVGVDRPFFLSDLKFSVDLNTEKGPVVRVRSEKPVREPFLNFVVQAQWPSGKLLREYTLLMDLPVFDERAAEPVTPAQEEPASTAGQPAAPARHTPEQRREPKPVADERLSGRTGAGERVYGPVSSGDTLWAIAAATRPDRSVSVQQSMLAIQRANPGAFIDDNINLLRKGQVLRIPSREEMAEMTARDAITEVAYQNQRWSDRRTQVPAERAQLEGSRSYSRPSGETSSGEGRVKLTSPDETSDSSEGRGTGAGSGSTAALENELAVTLEQLDASKSENAELKSRIEAMEEQIETLERLVTLSNEQMRALELATQDTTEGAAEGEGADSQQPDQQTPVATAKDDAETDAVPAAEQNAVEQPAQQEPTASAPPVRSRPAPEPTLLDRVLDNILYIALGFVALLGAAALYMRQRKNKSSNDEFEDFMVESDEDDLDAIGHFEEEEADYEPLENLEPEDNEIEGVLPMSDSEEDENHAEQETEDAVAEAEIYIALAKYDQAEDILARALAKEPQDVNIRLKLLEIYSSLEDLDKFDEHFAILRATDDSDAIEHATELRSRISGAPEFDQAHMDTPNSAASRDTNASARTSTETEDLAFDIDPDFGAFEEDTPTEIRPDDVKKSADSDDFGDFDNLTLDLDDELESDTASKSAASPASSDDDLNFDFDLDMADMAEETTEASTDADEIDLSDDFALELDDDELTTESDQASELTMLDEDDDAKATDDEAAASDELALDSDELDLDLDFNLESDEDKTATDEESLEMDSDLDFSLDDELDVTTAVASDSSASEAPQREADDDLDTEFNFDDLDFDGLDTDSSETSASDDDLENLDDLGESISTESLSAGLSGDDDEEDELDLDSEMDLSALDEELDAMAFELDDMGAPSAPEEPSEGEQPSAGEDFAFEEEPSANKERSVYKEPAPKTETPEQAPEAERPLSFGNRTYADLEEANEELQTIDPEADDDSDLGFLNDSDETATKLDLARAYIDMGDADGAKDILDEIVLEGNDDQRQEARKLLERIV